MTSPTVIRQKALRFDPPHRPAVPYLLHLPPGYEKESTTAWPLLVFLHGAGERGCDPAKMGGYGPAKMVEDGADFPFILVSPQCREGGNWVTQDLKVFLDFLIQEYRVETDRIYLTGLSMGGYATWNLASEYPEIFAAIAPVCGGGELIRSLLLPEEKKEALKRLPVRTFHGDRDFVVPISETLHMVDIFRRAGNENVELTIYPGVGHDSWVQAYATPGLFDWFLSHRRHTPSR